jgi:hypothetical protein
MSDPGLEQVLERYRAEWEAGRFDRLIPAFMFCAKNRLTVPDWLYEAVREELEFAYRNRQRGGPSSRTGAIQDASNRKHSIRHLMVKTELECQEWGIKYGRRKGRPNKREAAKTVWHAMQASKSFALGSVDAIIESYDLVESGGGKFEN